jgi:hypothetical protein
VPPSAGDDCFLRPGECAELLKDGRVELPDGRVVNLRDCLRQGFCFRFHYEDTEMEPLPEPAAPEPLVEAPVPSPEPQPAPAPAPPHATPAPAPAATVAHTEQPAASPMGDVADLAKLGGDNPLLVFGLAAIAILGGGSAWKLYQKKADAAHELKMKELELKAQPVTSPPPCVAKHGELDLKLIELNGKLSKLERKADSLTVGGPSTDELDERLVKVEKALKAKAKAGGAK